MVVKLKPSEETHQNLLKAATHLFARYGLDGTTVRDIAAHAGVNLSLVSYYFEGKEGLYRACIEEFGNTRLKDCQGLLSSVQSAEEFRIRIELIIDSILTSQAEHPELSKILCREIEAG